MKRRTLIFFCTIFFVTPLLLNAQDPVAGTDETASSTSSSGCPILALNGKIGLSVHIPGITKNDPQIKNCYYLKGDLVDYIKGLYTFGLTVGGFLAVIMIMVGGFIWAGAGGNPELVKKGQERVLNAIFGLILLLTSYTILNLINPQLVNLTRINKDNLPSTSEEDLSFEKELADEAKGFRGGEKTFGSTERIAMLIKSLPEIRVGDTAIPDARDLREKLKYLYTIGFQADVGGTFQLDAITIAKLNKAIQKLDSREGTIVSIRLDSSLGYDVKKLEEVYNEIKKKETSPK